MHIELLPVRIGFSACASCLLGAVALIVSLASPAGTDVRIVARDRSVLSTRSMDFGTDLKSRIVIRPRGEKFISPAPEGLRKAEWTGKYGFVYIDGFEFDTVIDGLNEAGLGIGALFLAGPTRYPSEMPETATYALSNLRLGTWLLSQFATVAEVRSALQDVMVWGEPVPGYGNWPIPLHFAVHDAKGDSLVLEWIEENLQIHDNTVGVLTNSPEFGWHLMNLQNYAMVSPLSSSPIQIGDLTFAGTGQGVGLASIPGDTSPPSRFVATVAALHLSARPKDALSALILGQKLMNRVDLPLGMVRNFATGTRYDDYTQWVVFRDHGERKYYWRTYEDLTLRLLELKKLDLNIGSPKRRMPIATRTPSAITVDPKKIPVLKSE